VGWLLLWWVRGTWQRRQFFDLVSILGFEFTWLIPKNNIQVHGVDAAGHSGSGEFV
jgi:hypothetical protein